jgi:hypothetical protein
MNRDSVEATASLSGAQMNMTVWEDVMTIRCKRNGMAVAFLCGLAFTSTTVSAQQPPDDDWQFVPVGPPVSNLDYPSAVQQPFFGPIKRPSAAGHGILRRSLEGIDFLGSNCGCLPPDTNAAVGNNFVVETVNFQIRIWNKTMGNILFDQLLAQIFGAPTGGDPYVIYDDIANRWYISAFDSNDSGLFLAVSRDGNPLHGFRSFHLINPPFPAGFPDYPKVGFNKDAIFISFNNFGPGGGDAATIVAINKLAAFGGTLQFFVSVPQFQFRAMPPAQLHGDTTGGVEWFVSTDDTDAGGDTIRVTEMTNYFSNTPNFTYTHLPVTPYHNAPRADQPGGSITTFPNTTTTQVQFHRGHLVTAMASGTPADGFTYPKALIFDVDVTGGMPVLSGEFVVDPGAGVAAQMPSVDMDQSDRLGVTWMESSRNEFLSMWVGTLDQNTGKLVSTVAAGGVGFFSVNFRIGDYSTTVLDPNGKKFWSANEYIGDSPNTNIWRTNITSFTAGAQGAIALNSDQ